jgi:hypothetical protein
MGLLLTLLSACGGEDASSSPAPPTNQSPPNQAPIFSSATATSVAENTTDPVYQAVASDPDGDAVTYSIIGGADASRFKMNATGQLTFIAPPNFDLASDADANNVYEVQIGASDGKASTTLTLSVTVTNSKEGVSVHRIATGFTDPVAIVPISATAMLVAEKAGAVYLLDPQTQTKRLLVRVANAGPGGIVAMTAAPTFGSDGVFFVMYKSRTGFLFIERYFASFTGGITVPDNYGPLLTVSAPQYAGGGWLGYNSNGVLLAATGDAGGAGDPSKSAQDDASPLGKLLRIERNPDPFAGVSPQPFLVSRIAKGFHQPNGGSQFGTSILLADHGQDVAEEINLISGSTGGNYGWPFKEGSRTVGGTAPSAVVNPVLEYFRSAGLRTGQAIIGGAVGPSAVPSLRNQYLLADGSGAIFAVDTALLSAGSTRSAYVIERRDADFAPDAGTITRPVAITAGPGGTVFILDAGGDIFRVDGS